MKLVKVSEIQNAPKKHFEKGTSFELIPEEIENAKEILGITLPVVIRIRRGKHQVGQWKKKKSENFHRINVSEMQSLSEINKTLWHEFQHAADEEKGIYHRTKGIYTNSAVEIRARETEERFQNHWLVREKTPA